MMIQKIESQYFAVLRVFYLLLTALTLGTMVACAVVFIQNRNAPATLSQTDFTLSVDSRANTGLVVGAVQRMVGVIDKHGKRVLGSVFQDEEEAINAFLEKFKMKSGLEKNFDDFVEKATSPLNIALLKRYPIPPEKLTIIEYADEITYLLNSLVADYTVKMQKAEQANLVQAKQAEMAMQSVYIGAAALLIFIHLSAVLILLRIERRQAQMVEVLGTLNSN